MTKKNLLILFFLMIPASSLASDDFQIWGRSSLDLFRSKTFTFKGFGEMRGVDDVSHTGFYLASAKSQFDYWKNVSLGVNLTAIRTEAINKKTRDGEFKHQTRYEFEINPHWNNQHLKIKNRNRLELRNIENKGAGQDRIRHGLTFHYGKIYNQIEVFYDFEKEKMNENRITPVGIKWELPLNFNLSSFYLFRSVKIQGQWKTTQVLGAQLFGRL